MIIKRILAALIAVVIAFTAAVGVSAAENIALLDWGWGYNFSGDFTKTTIPTGCTIDTDPNDVFVGSSSRLVMHKVGIPAASGYTYTYTNTFSLIGTNTAYTPCIGDQLLTLGYKFSNTPDQTYTTGAKYYKYDGNIKSALVTIERLSDNGYRLKVVYNPDVSGITIGDIYLYVNVFLKSESSIKPTLQLGNEVLVCMKDPSGEGFNSAVLDAVNQIKEDNENYHSNALELLDQLLNTGSDNPLPDAKDIKDQGTAMSTAEGAVRDKSSDLIESVSSDWTQYQTDAKNAALTLKPAAAAVNNVYNLIINEIPDEVKMLYVAITILLFIGWLIGRVRE